MILIPKCQQENANTSFSDFTIVLAFFVPTILSSYIKSTKRENKNKNNESNYYETYWIKYNKKRKKKNTVINSLKKKSFITRAIVKQEKDI